MINEVTPTDKLVFDLNMYQIDYNESKIDGLRKQIANKYNVPLQNVEINFKPRMVKDNGERISLTSDIIANIQDPKFQLQLFADYLNMKEIKDVEFEDICKIDEMVNKHVDFDSYSKYKNYRFKYVKWDNYLSYGKGNYFDFTTLQGLIALKGEPSNQCGKTTFAIDLLRFALFGKAQKSPTLDSVFNTYLPEETEVVVELGIEIDGCDYVIRRTITRPVLKKRTAKSKPKQKVEYYRKNNTNELELIENCEGESSIQTNNIIKETVGSVEDFNLVISATSYNLGDILRMGQSDKGKLFSRWLGLLTIEEKEQIAKELWKKEINPKLLSNVYNKTSLQNEITEYEKAIEENNNRISNCEQIKKESEAKIEELNKEKVNVLTQKKEVKSELVNLDINTLEVSIKSMEEEITKKNFQLSDLKANIDTLKDVSFDENEYADIQKKIEEIILQINVKTEENAALKTTIRHLQQDNERINELIEKKICPHCLQTINANEQLQHAGVNNVEIDKLINQGVSNKNYIENLQLNIENYKSISTKMLHNKDLVNERQKNELKIIAIQNNIESLQLQLKAQETKKEEVIANKEFIRINNEIDIKIRNLDVNIQTETAIKETQIKLSQNYINENGSYAKEIEHRTNLMKKLTEEEKIIKNWTIYQELVGKNGIIKIILKRALPAINNEISRILYGLCDFQVILSISDDNKVCIDLYRDNCKMDLATCASGFEGTFAALAIRSALASIGNIASPSMMCLDEVDATIAAVNYDKLTELYRRILNNYQFIIHIAHNELLDSIHNGTIIVKKENNVSKIVTK